MIRQRARKACAPCRHRKVKCNGAYPCDVCQGYGYECDYSTESNKKPKRPRSEEDSKELSPKHPSYPTHHSPDTYTVDSGYSDNGFHGSLPPDRALNGHGLLFVEVPNNKDPAVSIAAFPRPLISRFTTVYSAVAFPRELGRSLNLANAPRLHPFAWNTGMREERKPNLGTRVFDLVPLEYVLKNAAVYFDVIDPLLGLFYRNHFIDVCTEVWTRRQLHADRETLICGVIVLGSLFSEVPVSVETEFQVAEQARLLLEISVSSPPSQLSVKFVIGWLLRAVYLRCTTRPHLSWMASCNAMHIAESIGLHQEFGSMDLLEKSPRGVVLKEKSVRPPAFWVSLSLNQLFSVEYGRSSVYLDSITCSGLKVQREGHFTLDLVKLCQFLPSNRYDATRATEEKEALISNLQRLDAFDTKSPPLTLLKSDVCFSIFRKLRFLHVSFATPLSDAILNIIRAGLHEARSLSHKRSKWWNIISVPLHSVGVLIALDSPESLELLGSALETLNVVCRAYDTHLAKEALHTAEELVRGFREKKLKEAGQVGDALEAVVSKDQSAPTDHPRELWPDLLPLPTLEWPNGGDGGWMELFYDASSTM